MERVAVPMRDEHFHGGERREALDIEDTIQLFESGNRIGSSASLEQGSNIALAGVAAVVLIKTRVDVAQISFVKIALGILKEPFQEPLVHGLDGHIQTE